MRFRAHLAVQVERLRCSLRVWILIRIFPVWSSQEEINGEHWMWAVRVANATGWGRATNLVPLEQQEPLPEQRETAAS